MSNEVIKPPDNTLAPEVKFTGKRMYIKFSGTCLKQGKVTFSHKKTVNIYIVYDLQSSLNNFAFTLQNCLLGAVKLTKNSDIDKYEYAGYGIGFDSRGTSTHPSGGTGVNVIVFGVDMSSSIHSTNRPKSILILGRSLTQGSEGTTLYAEKMYSVTFIATRKKFCLSLRYNGDNSYLFVNGAEITKFKAKDSKSYQIRSV